MGEWRGCVQTLKVKLPDLKAQSWESRLHETIRKTYSQKSFLWWQNRLFCFSQLISVVKNKFPFTCSHYTADRFTDTVCESTSTISNSGGAEVHSWGQKWESEKLAKGKVKKKTEGERVVRRAAKQKGERWLEAEWKKDKRGSECSSRSDTRHKQQLLGERNAGDVPQIVYREEITCKWMYPRAACTVYIHFEAIMLMAVILFGPGDPCRRDRKSHLVTYANASRPRSHEAFTQTRSRF